MNRHYRIRKGMHPATAGYALTALSQLADGSETVNSAEQARQWAQHALDQMVADGYIEPNDEATS